MDYTTDYTYEDFIKEIKVTMKKMDEGSTEEALRKQLSKDIAATLSKDDVIWNWTSSAT